jgi:hypothetical protein
MTAARCRPMLVQRFSAMIGLSAVMMILAGCTTASQGEPIPASTVEATSADSSQPTSSGPELPYAGAPKVDNPLDTSRFQQDPCQALSPDQVQYLGFESGKPRDMPLGNACEWSKDGSLASVTVHFLDRSPYGLSAEYQANKDGKTGFFQVLPSIEGFPAVATAVVDDRDGGTCAVVVGVSDEISFEVPISLSMENIGKKDPASSDGRSM